MFLMFGDVRQRAPGWDIDVFYFARGAGAVRRGTRPAAALIRDDEDRGRARPGGLEAPPASATPKSWWHSDPGSCGALYKR